jgi:hypothetical protein
MAPPISDEMGVNVVVIADLKAFAAIPSPGAYMHSGLAIKQWMTAALQAGAAACSKTA